MEAQHAARIQRVREAEAALVAVRVAMDSEGADVRLLKVQESTLERRLQAARDHSREIGDVRTSIERALEDATRAESRATQLRALEAELVARQSVLGSARIVSDGTVQLTRLADSRLVMAALGGALGALLVLLFLFATRRTRDRAFA